MIDTMGERNRMNWTFRMLYMVGLRISYPDTMFSKGSRTIKSLVNILRYLWNGKIIRQLIKNKPTKNKMIQMPLTSKTP